MSNNYDPSDSWYLEKILRELIKIRILLSSSDMLVRPIISSGTDKLEGIISSVNSDLEKLVHKELYD